MGLAVLGDLLFPNPPKMRERRLVLDELAAAAVKLLLLPAARDMAEGGGCGAATLSALLDCAVEAAEPEALIAAPSSMLVPLFLLGSALPSV